MNQPFKLLIVDDEQIILKSYSRLLKMKFPEIDIQLAKNGLEGVQLIKSNKPDLVLLDLAMPEMNGFEVLATLEEEQIHLPIIVMTAFNTEDNLELTKVISNNQNIQVLRKPIEMDFLMKRIAQMLAQ